MQKSNLIVYSPHITASPGALLRSDSADIGTVVTSEQRSLTSRDVKYLIF